MKKRTRKKVMGRPKLDASAKRTPLGVPLSPAEREQVARAADKAGIPLAAFARRILLENT